MSEFVTFLIEALIAILTLLLLLTFILLVIVDLGLSLALPLGPLFIFQFGHELDVAILQGFLVAELYEVLRDLDVFPHYDTQHIREVFVYYYLQVFGRALDPQDYLRVGVKVVC
jgi:hypothetical protein